MSCQKLDKELWSQHKMCPCLSYMGLSLSFTVSTLEDRKWKITCLKNCVSMHLCYVVKEWNVRLISHLLAYNGFLLSLISSLNSSLAEISRHSLRKQIFHKTRVHTSYTMISSTIHLYFLGTHEPVSD